MKNLNNNGLDEVAELKSPIIAQQSTKDKCVEFWFQIKDSNTLNVYKLYPSQMKKILTWTLNGATIQGSTWLRATVPFTSEAPFHFILEG